MLLYQYHLQVFQHPHFDMQLSQQNLLLLQQLEVLHSFGCPVLLGTSRKSVIGLTLDVPAAERVTGTVATTVMGVMKGCSFVRVHDIKENVEAIKMTEAILHAAV